MSARGLEAVPAVALARGCEAAGIEAAVVGGRPRADAPKHLGEIERRLRDCLQGVESEVPVPFNRMSDWDEGGTIKPDAAVYSPFIRLRRRFDLG